MLNITTQHLKIVRRSLPLITLVILAAGALGLKVLTASASSAPSVAMDCTPTEKLVNPCRPWLGGFSSDSGGLIADIEGRQGVAEGLEHRTDKRVDVVRAYIPHGKQTINKESKYFIDRANTILFTNYKPSVPWSEASGTNMAVNARIDQMADSINANVPEGKKIMLSIDAEPEDDVSTLDPATSAQCPMQSLKAKTQSGSPEGYRAMWRNVRARFDAKGAGQKVVWVMNYMGYKNWDCLIKPLYPGDDLVDWVAWDPYVPEGLTWDSQISRVYSLLEHLTDETHQFTSKPWALPEFGSWHTTQSDAYKMYNDAQVAVEANRYPRIKLYSIFDAQGVRSSKIEYAGVTSVKDSYERAQYRQFVQSGAFTDPTDIFQQLPNNLTYTNE